MYSIPVHSAIVLPLIVYNNDPQVYVAACSAIYHIMSSDDCNGGCMLWVCTGHVQLRLLLFAGAVLEELAERGVGSTLEGLREHRDNHICLEWGCRALRTLIMDRYVNHRVMLYVTLCHAVCHTVCHAVCHTVSCCVSHCGCQYCYNNYTVLIRRSTWRCVWHCLI